MKFLIDSKNKDISKNPYQALNDASQDIKILKCFIHGSLDLSEENIERILTNLVQYGIYLDIPLTKNTTILRAVRYEEKDKSNPCYEEVSRLSYIPNNIGIIPPIGRMNNKGSSIFYGCLSNNIKSVNVAFSEVNALKDEYINVLKSTTKEDIKVRYIGIMDYYRRGTEPPFDVHPLFKKIWKYYKDTHDEASLSAVGLVDAFFSDILRAENYGRLYIVTSILASIIMEDETTDGLIYPSIKSEGSPNLALKPSSINTKVSYTKAYSFKINENYGYALYYATTLYIGNIEDKKIIWSKHENKDI